MQTIPQVARPLKNIARRALASLPESTVVPIVAGPLAGSKWLLRSGAHGYWLGTYEPDAEKLLITKIKPGMVCYDCGANVGHYTLLFSKLVGPAGKVVAFEPLPHNVLFLRRHLSMNRCTNVVVEDIALTNYDGDTQFSSDHSMSRIDSRGELRVTCRKLDSLNLPPPDFLKVDIEGAETNMLSGAESMLRSHRPDIYMSLHIPFERAKECELWLNSLGYVVQWSETSYDIYATHPEKPL